jgi:hypothetical protein
MFKRRFQRPLRLFFLKERRASAAIVAVSTMLLFLLFFLGNGHTLAKVSNVVQPLLLKTSTYNASTRSSGLVSFQVSAHPTIRLKPTSGFVGTSTTIVGDHFAPRVSVSVSFGKWLVAKGRTDPKGHFVLLFHVPLLAPPGLNLVKAVSANKKQLATASFNVIISQPSASLSPNHGLPKARITIKGKNFTSKGSILILFIDPQSGASSIGIIAGRLTASVKGTLNTHFTVPRGLKVGHLYTIQVVDIGSGHSISFSFMTK